SNKCSKNYNHSSISNVCHWEIVQKIVIIKRIHIIGGNISMSDLMKGKNIVVMGVANQRSIAWGIAQSLHREGANLIFTNRQQRSAQKLQKLLDQNEINAE